jgi:zinc protease
MVKPHAFAEEWAKEIRVVMEERRYRTDDRPRSLVYEQTMATALTAHPYRNPVIGWMSDLQSMTSRMRASSTSAGTHPNNRGGPGRRVGTSTARSRIALAEKHFGASSRGRCRRASRRTSRPTRA